MIGGPSDAAGTGAYDDAPMPPGGGDAATLPGSGDAATLPGGGDAYSDAAMILGLALGGDPRAVADGFADVVSRSGLSGGYGVALCLAATLIGDDHPGGGAALDFPNIDDAPYDTRWVARFISAYVNADRPTGEALFGAAVADGQLAACIATLTGSTLEKLRQRAE